jgi:hypothetical protein
MPSFVESKNLRYLILIWISLGVQPAAAEKIKLSRLDYQEPKPQLIEDKP